MGLAVRLLDAPLLDRLIRGRLWIGIVAFSLLGIVAMQVAILRLGTSIGASVAQIQRLTQSNEAAETAIAQDEPGRSVAAKASKLGMVYPPPSDVAYLRFGAGAAALASHSYTLPTAPILRPPSPTLTAPIEPEISPVTTTSDAAVATSGGLATPATGATSTEGTTGLPGTATASPESTTTAAGTAAGGPASTTAPTGAPAPTSLNSAGAASAPGTGATG